MRVLELEGARGTGVEPGIRGEGVEPRLRRARLPRARDASRAILRPHALNRVTRQRDAPQTRQLERLARADRVRLDAAVADEFANPPVLRPRDDARAHLERAAAEQPGDHGAAARVFPRLQDNASAVAIPRRPKVHRLRLEEERHLEVLHALTRHRAHVHALHVPAALLQRNSRGDELVADSRRVRAGGVAFGYRHDVPAVGRLDVRRRLARLRHHPVVRRAHEDGDVRALRAPLAHRREGRVTRGVEEGELAAVGEVHDERADVLRDPARLARGDGGRTKGVQQGGLAVVDVAHHGDDGASRGIDRRRMGPTFRRRGC